MGIPQDSASGREQFAARMEERRGQESEADWQAVRRGWCFGEEQFRNELLEQMSGQLGAHHGGSERVERVAAQAERILDEELKRLGWTPAELEQRRKGDEAKIVLARRLRNETTVTWSWIASRLHMGAAGYAANCVRSG